MLMGYLLDSISIFFVTCVSDDVDQERVSVLFPHCGRELPPVSHESMG